MNPVMCITKDVYPIKEGINKLTLSDDDIHFIGRDIVDSKLPNYHAVGCMFPQILPYIAVKCGNEYLTYTRKGSETRLHFKHSMGFGGHVELHDLQDYFDDTIAHAGNRELIEELGLDMLPTLTNEYIYSEYDRVSQVHIGAIGIVEIEDKSLVKPDENEVVNPTWLTLTSIRASLDKYERWSQILVKHLDK